MSSPRKDTVKTIVTNVWLDDNHTPKPDPAASATMRGKVTGKWQGQKKKAPTIARIPLIPLPGLLTNCLLHGKKWHNKDHAP